MEYVCKLGTETGEIIEKRYSAENENALRLELEQKGFYIFSLKPAGFSLVKGSQKKIKLDDFIVFNQEMRALLNAGLPAIKSLDILITRQKETPIGRMLQEVRNSIDTGSSISEAFAVHKHRLPIAYVSTLVAGERSGELGEAIGRYVTYARLTNTLRKNFQKALYYPVFLIILSFGMIGLMMLYVLPEFAKFYEGFEESLPEITLAVLGIADVLKNQGWMILAGIFVAIFLFRWWRRTEAGARQWARVLFALPLAGKLMHKYQLSQIFHSLAVMLRGGMPLLTCLEDLEQAVSNPLLVASITKSRRRVSEGESLTSALENTLLDTDLSLEMIQVGESTGALPEMLSNVAAFYDEEVQNRTEALLSLLEPLLLLLMAVVVGALLFSMYYPMFNLLGNMGARY